MHTVAIRALAGSDGQRLAAAASMIVPLNTTGNETLKQLNQCNMVL